MLDKSTKSRDKLTLTNVNFHSFDLNHSINNSFLTSSYIVLKDGTKKRKRHINSYMEEFLERRRMAAEFAQSKRSTSSKNYRAKFIKNEENMKDAEFKVDINIKKLEESININNLKNNLPGKTRELIDNTNNIRENNLGKYINIHNNTDVENVNKKIINNKIVHNKYNNFKRHNIIYTKKTNLSQNNNKNMNLSNHSFTEDRYNTNHENEDQCNIISINTIKNKKNVNNENDNINSIKDISPIKPININLNAKGGIDEKEKECKNNEKDEEKNEIENKEKSDEKRLNKNEHFLSIMERMINMNINKNQPSVNSLEKDSLKFNDKFKEYEKFLNISDNNNATNFNKISQDEENKEDKDDDTNKNDLTNKENFTIINNIKKEKLNLNMDDINNNTPINLNQKNEETLLKKINTKNEEYIVEENEEKNKAYEKEDENRNEEIEQEKSIERQIEEEEENGEEDNKINDINQNDNEEEENEDIERCEVLKGDGDKSKYLKGKKNIITEEIEEVEEGMEVNENTSEFQTIKSGRNKNSNRGIGLNLEEKSNSFGMKKSNSNSKDNSIKKLNNKDNNEESKEESITIIKEVKKYNNVTKIEIKDLKKNKTNNKNNNSSKNYNFIYSNTSKINEKNIEKNYNSIENIEESNNISNYNENNNILNISKSNNKEKEGNVNNNEMININNNLMMNNDDFNFNKLSDMNNLNSDLNQSPNETSYFNYEKNNKEKEDFMRIINKDIERLEKIRNNNNMINNEIKENESIIDEIDNFINLMRAKRKSNINNIIINDISYKNNQDYIPPKNILELKRIYKNLNNKNNININLDTNYNNIIQRLNYNKVRLPISKSSSLQSLLNEIKKEKTYNININNININNENKIINNNFFTEKINKEINDSFNKNIQEETEDNKKDDFKLFDETKFKKIKETNLRKRKKFRNEFKFKDCETKKNLSHIYLDRVKEDILMNISTTKVLNKNDIKNKWNIKKLTYTNNTDIDTDNSEIMPANNIKSLYNNKF